jgi:O-antigen/teichoic acid export membrane protein
MSVNINNHYRRIHSHLMQDSLYRNSLYLIANAALSSIFGFGFWAIAAHIYSTTTIGIVSTIIAASTLIATMSFVGFDYALIKFIPGSNAANKRTHTGLTATASIAVALSVVYLFVIPVFVAKLSFLSSSPAWAIGFVLLVVVTVWNTLTNSIFIAHRITQYALIAGIGMGIIRLPLLYLLRSHGIGGLFLILLSTLSLAVVLCFGFLRRYANYSFRLSIDNAELRHMGSYATATYLSNIIGGLPALVLPIIILKMIGSKYAAYFYIASMIGSLLYIIPYATGQSLFAEGNWDAANLNHMLWRAARLMSVLVISAVICVIALGWTILGVFGKHYQRSGYILLILLALTGIPKIASYLFSTVLRVHNRIGSIIIIATIGTVIQLAVSIIGLKVYKSLAVLGVASILCEIFVATSYTILFLRHKNDESVRLAGE